MRIHTMEVVCDVCGGEGVATPRDASTQWVGGSLRHSDLRICAENLRLRKEALDRREKELKENE
jgi:hypothetical protein